MIYLTMYWETALVDYDPVERWRNASPESRIIKWRGYMNSENYTELKKQFEAETDDLLNKICDTFHDELKLIANKYGIITVSIKTSDE